MTGAKNGGESAPEVAVALVIEGPHGQIISAVTDAARAGGARIGARLTDACALEPGLVAVAADVAGDAALLARLARWAGRWSPLVEVDGVDGIRMDVSGVAHLFGGEAGLVADVEGRFAKAGVTVRCAVAGTAGAAWALARYSSGDGTRRVPSDPSPRSPVASRPLPQGERERLFPLPVAALRLSPAANHTLNRLGLKTIGALVGVPRRSLARRFREADNPLDALDRLLGRTLEPLTGLADEPPPRAVLRLAEPVADPGILASALARLADPLAEQLAARRLGARRVALVAWRVDGEVHEVEAETSLPTREAGHIVRLLAEKVAVIDPGYGIDAFAIEARWCEPLAAGQDALIGEPPRELELARLIDRLVVRLGAMRVRRPAARESHVPERASEWVSGLSSPRFLPAQSSGRICPARLLDNPEAVGVVYATPEGVPRRFMWRRGVHDIARVEGPERIAPEWWRELRGTRLRDYYRVEDGAGRRYWIFREGVIGDGRGGAPMWFMHGLFG
jgi:protein ImuB